MQRQLKIQCWNLGTGTVSRESSREFNLTYGRGVEMEEEGNVGIKTSYLSPAIHQDANSMYAREAATSVF